ncbi:thioesterase family protein [Pseudomonas nitroreducens]|uniref:Thioesterase family protein n=1 Tax=Pseudomonas nitroreducens TaxID=46680 RepID=A0ABS0KGF5_PSENT|nr:MULTISPECIES: acyl-CoA thioesterase domain-containing protein [Pseudomonas aeruginosa group]MBG6287034.1 thioesterase family protein [Pseudomonas nitroreducens]
MTILPRIVPADTLAPDLPKLFQLQRQAGGDLLAVRHDANLNGRAFGGQLLGQALMAARSACPVRLPASLHCLFLQGAQVDQPLRYQVEVLQSGKRFTSLRVSGLQGEKRVLDAQATFQVEMGGYAHVEAAPDLPGPDALQGLSELDEGAWARFEKAGLELRIVNARDYLQRTPEQPVVAYWVKLREPLTDDADVHCSALAYLSDFWINSAAISYHMPIEHARDRLFVSSLNHSLWFHQACRADGWLLFVSDSPCMQMGRGLSLARIYDQSRRLVASVAQDCLVTERQ